MMGAGIQILSGVNTYTGGLRRSMAAHCSLGNGGARTGSIAGSVVTDNSVLAINLCGHGASNQACSPAVWEAPAASRMHVGPGLFLLSVANGYSGGTYVSGGTLRLGNSNGLGTGGLTANGGVFDLFGNAPIVPSFSGSAGVVANNLASTFAVLTVNNTNPTTFFRARYKTARVKPGCNSTAEFLR